MKKIVIIIVILLAALLAYAANIPPVVTGCRVTEVTEPNKPISGIWWNDLQEKMRQNTINNLKFHYNGVVEGKWGLSPKYESIDALKELIREYEDPSSVVIQGWLVEQTRLREQTEWKYEMFERVANHWQQKEISKAK